MAFVEICKVCGAHFISEDPRDMGRFICEDDVFEEPDRYPQGIERHDIFEHADKAPPLLPFLPVEPTKENAA